MIQIQHTSLNCGITVQTGTYLAQLLLQKICRVVGTSRDTRISSFGNLANLGIHADAKALIIQVDPNNQQSIVDGILEGLSRPEKHVAPC